LSDIYLVDSNIWIGHSMAYPDAVDYFENQLIKKEKSIAINTVIQMELLSHKDIENPEIRAIFDEYINVFTDEIYEITSEIAEKAGEIRRKAKVAERKVLKGPDALIAATASVLNLPLVSNNDKDFIWASTHPNFGFTYINPIIDNDHYKSFQQKLKENNKLRDI
jgi:predicted nucleic acid-binding protein